MIDWYALTASSIVATAASALFYRWGIHRGRLEGFEEGFNRGRDIQRGLDEDRDSKDCERIVQFIRRRFAPRQRSSDRDVWETMNGLGLTEHDLWMIARGMDWRRQR